MATLSSCSINADVFSAWLASDLLPKLTQPSVIAMDNASFHQRADCQRLIEQAGHTLLFLPSYSPDFNPIEKNGRKLKRFADKKDVMSMSFSIGAFNKHFIVC